MIKAFLIAALSADGFIARDSTAPSTAWTSPEDKARFVSLTKASGICIMGSKTWQTFGSRPLKERLNIVYSRRQFTDLPAGVETTNKTPAELLHELKDRGFREVAICGGASIYTLFLKAGLIDRLYITIEPVLFGRGIKLFEEIPEVRLELIETERTATGTLFLTYEVKK